MHTTRFALAAVSLGSLVFAAGCKDGANKAAPDPAPAPATAPMVTEGAPIKEVPPGGPVFLAPPLGAPDAIAPTTLDLLPGMRVADAAAKGATPVGPGNDWNWRPEADLRVDKEHGIIKEIVGKYTPAEIEALKQKWGKPTFGEDYWMGANWLAEIGSNCGSQPPCYVYFARAPNETFFGKTPVPPIGLAKLQFDTLRSDVTKLVGVEPATFTATGYGYTVSYDFTKDKLRSVTLASSTFIEKDQEIKYLTSLWGAPAKLGDDSLVWVDPAAHWAMVHDVGQLNYYPILLWSELLAKTGPHSIVATGTQLLGHKKAEVGEDTRVWPGTEAEPSEVIAVEPYFEGDDELATSLGIGINLPEAAIAPHVAMIEKALGKAKVVKDEDGEEQSIITTDGLAIQVKQEGYGIALTVTKATP